MQVNTIAEVISALHDRQRTNFTAAAGLALYIYDILITLDREYRHIWQARWSFGKVLYLIVRYPWMSLSIITIYMNVAIGVSAEECKELLHVRIYGGLLHALTVQSTMVLRTYAIYQKKKWVLCFLSILVAVCTAADLVLVTIFIPHIQFFPGSTVPILAGCINTCIDCEPLYRWFWVPQAILDFVIAGLTFIKAVEHYENRASTAVLLKVLYRDGFAYFTVIFGCQMIQLIMWNAASPSKMELLSDIMRAMYAITCSRLLLNIRGVLTNQETSTVTQYSYTHRITESALRSENPINVEDEAIAMGPLSSKPRQDTTRFSYAHGYERTSSS